MANVTCICARSAEIRDAFIKRVQLEKAPFEGLSAGRTDLKISTLCWLAPAGAPISGRRQETESFFTAGDPARDSYFLSISEDSEGGVTVRTDWLGLFPVYYYSTPEILIFSTTPSVFKLFPEFRSQLDMEGLVGILLVNFIVEGRTLLKGVRRLTPGHRLSWKPGSLAEEIKSDLIVPSDRYFKAPFKKNLETVDGLFASAVQKWLNDKEPVMLLSGGLDSRLLAGYLHAARGRGVHALTQGNADDLEMKCSKMVAKALHFQHQLQPADGTTFSDYAHFKLEQEHLAHGFNTPYFAQLAPAARSLGTGIFMGVHGDSALGCATAWHVRDPKTKGFSFEAHFKHLNRSGLSPECIQKLIPADLLKEHLKSVMDKLKNLYHALPGEPFQRAWLFDLTVADRLQVGFIPRVLAFGAWPRLPFVNRELLEAVAGMPDEALSGRRMERELVFAKFPRLAALPLDRNSYDLSPVIGLKRMLKKSGLGAGDHLRALRWHVEGKISKWTHARILKGPKQENRFYYRTFDINGEAWRAFRREAEPYRSSAENFLNAGTLKQLWPGPTETVSVKDGITGTQSLKVLLGFSLWVRNNL